MRPFDPIGDEARWKLLYDGAFHGVEPGTTVTYDDLAAILDLHPRRDRQKIQAVMPRVNDELLSVDRRAVQPVPGVGYAVISAEKHIDLGLAHGRKGRRSIGRGLRALECTRISELSEDARRRHEILYGTMSAQNDMLSRSQTKRAQAAQAAAEKAEARRLAREKTKDERPPR